MNHFNNTLDRLLTIDPSKECLQFLHQRVQSPNYRGVQISQHNRYSFEQVVGMLQIFYNIVGTKKMGLRTADLSKRPYNLPNEKEYAEYTTQVNAKYNKSTQDSIRKNLFVDFHRMGLIDRYNKNGIILSPYENGAKYFASLTNLALELIDSSKTMLERQLIFSRCLDNLLQGLASSMLALLASDEIDGITMDEYTFFFSFLRQSLGDVYYDLTKLKQYILQYRSLSKFQKDFVSQVIKDYCNPDNFKGDKTAKRDFHNWQNETQQVFMLLDMTVYYELMKNSKKIILRVNKDLVFQSVDDIKKLNRSYVQKAQYFTEHSVPKQIGFELHHIIPLLWAKTATQFFLLDKWQNLLYIDGYTHSKITQLGNKHIKLSFIDKDIVLRDFVDNSIQLDYCKNAVYNTNKQSIMLEHNFHLLESFPQ